ncbi:zinc finger protein 8-like [Zingiber officinale]|nr:zinc finger protein 8-like [Zingiber officinale]
MSEKEERDLMTVDSFSQLPFIGGRLPAASKLSSSSSGIRLFGIEVARQPSFDGDVADERAGAKGGGGPDGGADAGESSRTATAAAFRKFECHYCGRQFPTSQALGGHQNAHKRERQHAKRAQLNQYSAAFYGFGHGHRQLYGVMNSYNHQYSAIPSHVSEASFSGSWRLAAPVAQPINGSPLPGRGGVSPAMPLQPLRAEGVVAAGGTNISTAIISSSSSSHQFMIRNLKEKVSLDLHL